jgi:predicted nucleic acid-binding Zn ribbon protein
MTAANAPSGDSYVTADGCPVCGESPSGRARYCSPRCRQAAYRRRQGGAAEPPALPPPRSRREHTVYACPDCETRYLAEQWCADCNRPCRRLGAGGYCPCCDEPITVDELIDDAAVATEVKARPQ